jgi:hypothetical protein
MMGKTIAQRYNLDGIVKAGEMIEVRQSSALTLHDRRVINLLIRHAGEHIADDREHIIPMRHLRSPTHKGGERVRDSIERLMTTLVLRARRHPHRRDGRPMRTPIDRPPPRRIKARRLDADSCRR